MQDMQNFLKTNDLQLLLDFQKNQTLCLLLQLTTMAVPLASLKAVSTSLS